MGETPSKGRALITGASSGIGAEYARQLAAMGYDLTLTARREDRLAALAADLAARHGVACDVLAADLARAEDVARLETAVAACDELLLLVNNAGFGTRGRFAEIDVGRQVDMINVHIVASIRLARAALPGMIARGRGAIINVSSVAAFFPSAGGATYGATKAYLNAFSEALQGELAGTGVSIQALCPGFTYSEFHDTPEYEGFSRSQVPERLWMTAEEVVAESLKALDKGPVVVVPGVAYRAAAAAANGFFGAYVRGAGRRLARKLRRM